MSYWIVDGQKLTNEQYGELQRQKKLEQQKIQEESVRLSSQLSQAYAALKEHLERNPEVSREITDEQEVEQQIYYKLCQNLRQADEAPRCTRIREDGTVCKSPRMKNDIHCYAHYRMRDARAENLWLPPLTDANAIQMAVMLVQKALIDDEISEKKAGLLLYSIQLAATNVDKTTFGESDDEMVTEAETENEVMDANRKQMEARKRIEEVKTLPLMNTDDADLKTEEKTSPRINTDVRGSEKTSPRINTDETDQERLLEKIPPQTVSEVYANRSENSEVHANLG